MREPKIFSVRRNERNQSPNAFQRRGVSPRTNHTLSGGATSHQPPAWTNKQVSRTSSRPPLLPPLLPPLFTPVRPPRPHVSLRERAPRLEGEAARGRPLAAGGAPWGWRAARLWAPWPERGPLAPHRAATPCWRRPVVQASSGGKGRGAALWPREKMACVARPVTVSVAIVSIAIDSEYSHSECSHSESRGGHSCIIRWLYLHWLGLPWLCLPWPYLPWPYLPLATAIPIPTAVPAAMMRAL